LAGLGDTLWWLGRTDDAIRYQEQAYAAFRRCGDPAQSAVTAAGLYLLYRVSLGNTAAARGWLARAARLVERPGWGRWRGGSRCCVPTTATTPMLPSGAGTFIVQRQVTATEACWSREARASATGFGDPDLELCAISQLGASLLQQGRLAEGTALLDEAMAASLAGECPAPAHRRLHQLQHDQRVRGDRGGAPRAAVDPGRGPVHEPVRQPAPVRSLPRLLRGGPFCIR
jgi:hypothetical protein